VYILLLILFIPFAFSDVFLNEYEARSRHGIVVAEFPHQKVSYAISSISILLTKPLDVQLAVYLSSLLSLMIATLLGFLDDVFDIRWRHKLPVPIIASVPLLMVYYAERGNTNVVVPIPLRWIFGTLVNLGA
jgi:UDP-N-acetylglucosamine--dolichyl-phosphate N-acetylglucosaminephosphotransferase